MKRIKIKTLEIRISNYYIGLYYPIKEGVRDISITWSNGISFYNQILPF